MEGERHDAKRQGEADGERSAEEAMVEGRDGRTKEGRGGRAARTGREQTAPAGHFETFARREGCPPLPHHLVCVEKFTLPSTRAEGSVGPIL